MNIYSDEPDLSDDECNYGVVKCKKKYIIKKGASSQNYLEAESTDFQYKSKKYFDKIEFIDNLYDDIISELFLDNVLEYDELIHTNQQYIFTDILRFFIPSPVRNVGSNTVIHTFSQNSHDQNINESLQKSVDKITTRANWENCLMDAKDFFGEDFVKKYMIWKDENIKLIYGKIWSRILTYDQSTKNEAINILKNEIIEGHNKCITGKINRIISSLCGIDKDIQQKISMSQQFTLIFDVLRSKFSKLDPFSIEFLELFKKECLLRNIDENEIDIYIKSINI
jgi:hypothetical protein